MQTDSRTVSNEHVFKIWSSVVMLNQKNFDKFIDGHEISRTLYKVVLFVQLSKQNESEELRNGVSQFHYLAHNFTHRFALNNTFRLLFGLYVTSNDSYPSCLPATSDMRATAKLVVIKSLADEMLEFGGELDTYNFRNNCSVFISECIKAFQKKNSMLYHRHVIKWKSDSWYKCIGINEVAWYTDRPIEDRVNQEQSKESSPDAEK